MHPSLKRPAVGPPDNQPPSNRQNLDISKSFEYVEDIFNDDTHHRMDKQVIEDMGIYPPQTRLTVALLLRTIVHFSAKRLQSKYTDLNEGQALLAEHDGLTDLLKDAWSNQSFKKIRNLKILNVPSKPKSSSQEIVDPKFNTFPNRGIYSHFLQSHFRLTPLSDIYCMEGTISWQIPRNPICHTLNRMKHSKPYCNTVSIMQSSGSGKSRMVDNLAHLVFTIPFNIRLPSNSQDLAFPPPDTQIYTLLTRPRVLSINGLYAYYLRFLRHVFEEICKILTGSFYKSASSYAALATSWRCHLESDGNRQSLYDSVAKALMKSFWYFIFEKDIVLVEDYKTETRKAFDQLSTAIDCCILEPTQPSDERIKVVMYFDECHTPSTVPPPSNIYNLNPLDMLCKAIDSLSSRPLVATFLSTTFHMSTMSRFAPSVPYSGSVRVCRDCNEACPPITKFPFDCGPMLPVASNMLRLQDTCMVEFMAQFGRPLFWSMINSAGNSKDRVLPIIIDFARSKLLCYNDINVAHRDPRTKLPNHAPTAVLDLRLMFDYGPRQEARTLEAELVASHMRTVFSISETQEYLCSGYPSEPLLAEAAAQQMRVFRSYDEDFTVDTLKYLKWDHLDREKCGELVARELLTSAYDRAIEREFQSSATDSSSSQLLYSRGVSVITFIEELFVSHCAEQILDSIPNNVENPTPFREAFQKAKIRFTHFSKTVDESGTTSDAVWVALIRRMAIIVATEKHNVDFIIPVLLREDATICEEAVTGMLILVKCEVDENTIKFFLQSESTDASQCPYIRLVMELGIELSSDENTSKEKMHASCGTLLPPRESIVIPENGLCHHHSSKHPQYNIFAYGCSNTLYKGITPTQCEKYQFLLASGLPEHPW